MGEDAHDSCRDGKEVAEPNSQSGGQLQQTLERLSDHPCCFQRDISILREARRESAASGLQESTPSIHSADRWFYDPNHIQRDTPLKRDIENIGDMVIRESTSPQQSWKRRRDNDSNHIIRDGIDIRNAGKAIADVPLPQSKPSEFRANQHFYDSNNMEKYANNLHKVGHKSRDRSSTVKHCIDSKEEDHSIIWPPIVIIENLITGFNKTTNKWEGLKNTEIKSCLKSIKDLEYKRVIAMYNHLNGHRGSALVVFDANDLGFMNADNLSQCLQRASRGRAEWYRVRPQGLPINEHDMEQWNANGLIGDDGTRTIYGYLAEPSDLKRINHFVKVSVESYVGMVLERMKRSYQENEKVRRDLQELAEEAEQKRRALELEKIEINQVAEKLKKKNNEVQHYREQQEKAEQDHKMKMEIKRREFDEAMKLRLLQYEYREREIRSKLNANKLHFEKETEEYRKTENELEIGIQKEKSEQELRLSEIREKIALRQMRLEKELQARMEKRYAELEERLHKKKLELQAKHHKQILEFKEKVQKEKQEFLHKKIEEKKQLEKELDIARQETEKLAGNRNANNEQATDCVICHTKFGTKISRALYEDCGHKDICMNCAKKQKFKKKCPICGTQQAKNYVVVPYKIFC